MLIGKARPWLLGAIFFTLCFQSCSNQGQAENNAESLSTTVAQEAPAAAPEIQQPVEVDTPESAKPVVLEDWEHQYEREIEIFEEQEAENPSAKGGVVFTGSSSIRMWKTLEEDMAPVPAINRGFGGSTLRQVNAYSERIIFPLQPSLIVLYCGENDIAMADQTAAETVEDFEDIVNLYRFHLPETPIIFLSMKPSPSRWKYWDQYADGNEQIRALCDEDEFLTYIDVGEVMLGEDGEPKPEIFIKDRLHMNEQGYQDWTNLIKEEVRQQYEALTKP